MKSALRRLSWLLISGLWLLVNAGCRPESAVQSGNKAQILHRGLGPDLADLDPALATGTSDYTVLSALFEGLVAEDPVDLHPVPGVAESWEVSGDGLTYTFHLRASARWSDGTPVTATDFLGSWRRVLTPSLGAENASLLYIVQGAQSFHQGRVTDFAQVGFAAPDARTVRITLEHPAAYFLSLLQHWVWWPVNLGALQKTGPLMQRGNPWARPGTFVGNGPFTLKEWQPGQRIVVGKSATYWDAAQVRLAGICFYPLEDVNAEERAFRAGQLHITEALPVAKIDAYRHDSPGLLRIDPYLGTYFYRINVTRPFLNAAKVRQALSLAVDRSALVEKVLRGGQQPATTFTPPGLADYAPPAGAGTDFTRARQLLADAGYPGGQGAPVIELLFNTSENHRVVAEAVQEMWRRELHLQVNLVNMENKSVLEARRTGAFQLLRSNWIADYADPVSFLSVWRGDSGNNYTGWSNPDYDGLLFQAARTPDPAARNALFQKAETLLLADAPLIPVYYYTHVFAIQPSVQGWHPTLLDHHPYKAVWLKE